MKSKYTLLILLAGAVGAVLRSIALLNGYEADTGLAVRGYVPAITLIVLTAAVILAAGVWSTKKFQEHKEFEQLFGGNSETGKAIGIVCGVVNVITGLFGLLCVNDLVFEQTKEYVSNGIGIVFFIALLWLLCLISGIMMIAFSLWQKQGQEATKKTGLYLTLPLFWCCIDLIMIYHENSGNPVISDYSYQLLLTIAVMAGFYTMAAFLFSSGSTARFMTASGIAVYLSMTQGIGTLIAHIANGSAVVIIPGLYNLAEVQLAETLRMWAYLAAAIFLLVQMVCVNKAYRE